MNAVPPDPSDRANRSDAAEHEAVRPDVPGAPAHADGPRHGTAHGQSSVDVDEALLAHLDALYAFAQLVTPDAEAAARLVRDTYARAFATPVPPEASASSEGARTWLYGLLLDERVVMRDNEVALGLADDNTLSARRFALSETLVEQLLPAALLALPPQLRLMLVLCDVQGLSCEEAGDVVGVGPETGCDLLVEAQETLVANMRAKAAVHEVPILERMLEVPGSMRRALADALERELDPLPPTLRPTIPLPERRTEVQVQEGPRSRLGWLLTIVLALVATAAVAYWQRRPVEARADDLIDSTVEDAAVAAPATPLSSLEAAEAFVYDQAGWRVRLPTIRGYRVDGAAMRDVAPDVSVPVVRYVPDPAEGTTGPPVLVYAYTYRLLDIARARLALEPAVLAGLEDEAHTEQVDAAEATVLVWRSRDDVLVAVARPAAPDLASRVER